MVHVLISSNCFKIPGSSSILWLWLYLKISCNFCWYSLIFFRYWYSQWINCYNSSRLKLMLIFLADLLFYCYIINGCRGCQHSVPGDVDTASRGISTKSQGISTRVLVDIPFNFVDILCDNLLISLLTLLISLLISQWNINNIDKHYNLVHIPRSSGYCVDIPYIPQDIVLISLGMLCWCLLGCFVDIPYNCWWSC